MKEFIRLLRIKILHAIAYLKSIQCIPDSLATAIIIAPHPDDEVIGCGGLIKRLLDKGKEVHVIILSGGERSHNGCCQVSKENIITERKALALKAAHTMGVPIENLHLLDYPDGGVEYDHKTTEKLKKLIDQIQPNTILIPHREEGWSDHLKAGFIIKTLTENKTSISIYEYCVWFWYYNSWKIDWKNAYILQMSSSEHKIKKQAIDNYFCSLAPCGKPWSGVLPRTFVKANRWNKELYFKIR